MALYRHACAAMACKVMSDIVMAYAVTSFRVMALYNITFGGYMLVS